MTLQIIAIQFRELTSNLSFELIRISDGSDVRLIDRNGRGVFRRDVDGAGVAVFDDVAFEPLAILSDDRAGPGMND